VAIYPNKTSAPYQDWRKMIADLPEEQRVKVVGKANMQLIDQGVVKWEDVVTTNRVRLLREVVSREKLTVDQMTKAGVKERWAKDAWASVNTPAHQLAAQQRTELLKQILDMGIKPQHLKEMFGERMAARIGIFSGPSGTSGMPGKSDATWIRILQNALRPAAVPAAVKKKVDVTAPASPDRPKPGKENLPVTDFIPAEMDVPIIDRNTINTIAAAAPTEAISPIPVGLVRVQAHPVIGALQDLVNKRIAEFYRDNPDQSPIVVIFQDGKFFVHEGHHRAVGAVMRGDFSVPGLIFERVPGTAKEPRLMTMDQNGNLHPFVSPHQ
jgi:hypothetical protein